MGASLYDSDRKRLQAFSAISLLIGEISAGIRYTCSSVEDILLQCAENPFYKILTFLQTIADETRSEGFRSDTVRRAIVSSAADMNLKEEDLRPLLMMADNLGTTDVQGQLQMLETCRRQIEETKDREKKRCETLGKMYISLGFLLGLGAVVIMA